MAAIIFGKWCHQFPLSFFTSYKAMDERRSPFSTNLR